MLRKIGIAEASIHELITARLEDTLADIHDKLRKHNSVVVVDPTGYFQGIVSRRDVVMSMINRSDWKDIPVSEVMTTNLIYVPNHITLAEAAEIMLESDTHQLVVTGPPEGGFIPIGLITLQDVVDNAV